jgi:thiol-disulfide isomerase/thioredoxin
LESEKSTFSQVGIRMSPQRAENARVQKRFWWDVSPYSYAGHIRQSADVHGGYRGSSTVGRSATLTVEAAKTQQFTSFEDMVRSSDVPVLVDFHATWCGPCKLMGDALRVSHFPAPPVCCGTVLVFSTEECVKVKGFLCHLGKRMEFGPQTAAAD